MSHKLPQRKSPRLENFNYAESGGYFITICTQHRFYYFGVIQGQDMALNDAGRMLETWWFEIEGRFNDIICDSFVVMPNHVHGILFINRDNKDSIIDAVQWFKSITTNKYGYGVREKNWRPYRGKLWQRSFHDRIIRDENELNILRQYIQSNPALWEKDENYNSE